LLFIAATRRVRGGLRAGYYAFVAAFREAAEKLKAGDRTAAFPIGSFPPALSEGERADRTNRSPDVRRLHLRRPDSVAEAEAYPQDKSRALSRAGDLMRTDP
jgi:hypothetical protein